MTDVYIEEYRKYLEQFILFYPSYEWIGEFHEGIARCGYFENCTKYGFVDRNLKLISGGFDKVRNFSEGLAYVQKNGVQGFVDKNFNLKFTLPNEYETYLTYVRGFKDGKALFRDCSTFYYVDTNGNITLADEFNLEESEYKVRSNRIGKTDLKQWFYKPLSGETIMIPDGYDPIRSFKDDLAIIRPCNENPDNYYYLSKDETITPFIIEVPPVLESQVLSSGLTCRYTFKKVLGIKEGTIQFLDKNGLLIKEYRGNLLTNFNDGYMSAEIKEEFNGKSTNEDVIVLLDQYGEIIPIKQVESLSLRRFLWIVPHSNQLNKAFYDRKQNQGCAFKEIRVGLKKYYGVFEIEAYMFCFDKGKNFYLLNKQTQKVLDLNIKYSDDVVKKIRFTDKCLWIDDKRYFFVKDRIYDISAIYEDYVFPRNGVNLDNMLSFDAFVEKARKNPNLVKKEQAKLIQIQDEGNQAERDKIQKDIKEHLRELSRLSFDLLKFNQTSATNDKVIAVPELIFVKIEDHYIINPYIAAFIKYIDFTSILFDNVDISGVDFSETNAHINPQTVYKKNLSNCKFADVDFNGADFLGVNICGADFTGSILHFALNIENAIKDENTKLPEVGRAL